MHLTRGSRVTIGVTRTLQDMGGECSLPEYRESDALRAYIGTPGTSSCPGRWRFGHFLENS